MVRLVTSVFIISAPVIILTVDMLIWRYSGDGDTITGVVRAWREKSAWPEVIYVFGVAVLYLHLFRGWPDCWIEWLLYRWGG